MALSYAFLLIGKTVHANDIVYNDVVHRIGVQGESAKKIFNEMSKEKSRHLDKSENEKTVELEISEGVGCTEDKSKNITCFTWGHDGDKKNLSLGKEFYSVLREIGIKSNSVDSGMYLEISELKCTENRVMGSPSYSCRIEELLK